MKPASKLLIAVIIILSTTTACGQQDVRPPAVAGQFYPASAKEIIGMVDGFLAKTDQPRIKQKPIAIICPHAGYVFCGAVAAFSYQQIKGRQYDTVIIVGNSHHYPLTKAAVYSRGWFETPLGKVRINEKLADELISQGQGIEASIQPHMPEHCIEVQIPFLQRVLANFQIVPVLASSDEDSYMPLGRALANACKGKNVLLVASTDMTHYPSAEDADKIDTATLKVIETLDPKKLAAHIAKCMGRGISNLRCVLCAEPAVEAVIAASRLLGADKAEILHYSNSGEVPEGSKEQVVGYGAVAIYPSGQKSAGQGDEKITLNPGEQKKMLKLARETLEKYLSTGKKPDLNFPEQKLTRISGAFVTLKKHGMLRGCIGHIEAREPLAQAVRDLAIASATEDSRFQPVTKEELKDIDIEISVLSPATKVDSADDIVLGKHGVIVRKGYNTGVFLPQVATETGWTKEEFLNELCSQKAGLPPDAWRDKDTELFVFTAQVFGEKE